MTLAELQSLLGEEPPSAGLDLTRLTKRHGSGFWEANPRVMGYLEQKRTTWRDLDQAGWDLFCVGLLAALG